MKRKFFQLLLFAIAVLIFFQAPVKAASSQECTPIAQELFREASAAVAESTGDSDPHLGISTLRMDIAGAYNVDLLLNGVLAVSNCGETLSYNPYGEVPLAWKMGLAGMADSLMMMAFVAPVYLNHGEVYARMFTPPIYRYTGSEVVYAESGSNIFPEKEASQNSLEILYGIKVLVDLWTIMLGIAGALLVIILIAAGFMVMFRQKVQGQMFVTVGMSLQGVVIGFIGALASFAFGGMFFNLSKIGVFWVGDIFLKLHEKLDESTAANAEVLLDPSAPFKIIAGMFSDKGGDVRQKVAYEVAKAVEDKIELEKEGKSNLNYLMEELQKGVKYGWKLAPFGVVAGPGGFITTFLVGAAFGVVKGVAKTYFSAQVAAGLGWLIGLFVQIILGIIGFVISFRIFIKLISTYVNMFLQIILAPLIFVVGSLPGKFVLIGNWFKKMFLYALVPPVMFFLLNFGFLLVAYDIVSSAGLGMSGLSGGTWTGGAPAGFLALIGFGRIAGWVVMFMAPKAEEFLMENFGMKKSAVTEAAVQDFKKTFPFLGLDKA